MKRLAKITLLVLPILLSGCSLTNIFNNNKQVKFEEKGEEVEYTTFIQKIREEERKKNYDVECDLPSFYSSRKEEYKRDETILEYGLKTTNSDHRTYNDVYKYDRDNLLLSLKHSRSIKVKRDAPEGNSIDTTKASLDKMYQIEGDDFVVADKKAKTYYFDEEYLGNGEKRLNIEVQGAVMQSIDGYSIFGLDTKFYINNNIFTIISETTTTSQEKDLIFNSEEQYMSQMIYKDDKWEMKRTETYTYNRQYNNGNEKTTKIDIFVSSTITFQNVSLKKVDIFGYHKVKGPVYYY